MLKNYLSKLFAFLMAISTSGYLFAQSAVQIDAPASIAGSYFTSVATFSGTTFGQTGDVVLVDDGDDMGGTTSVSDGCEAIVNDVNGKIALIDRGTCAFTIKTQNAIDAGAIAVVICNFTAPDDPPYTAVGTPPFSVPVMMLSNADCEVIKAELGNGVSATMIDPAANQTCITATDATLGVNSAPAIDGGFGRIYTDGSVHGLWYRYTAASDGVLTVSSCASDSDTRLYVIPGADCDEVSNNVLAGNAFVWDDECGASGLSTEASWLVNTGETYHLNWVNAWSSDAFDFEISEGAYPDIDVTFNVDMQFTTTAPEGAYIAGTFNNWTPEPMTDNGNDTYSFTVSTSAVSEIQWKYLNGPDGWESGDLSACGIDDGFGGYNRYLDVESLNNINLGLVCFSSCAGCVPTDCDAPIAIVDDNFDSYTVGVNNLGPQADHWSTWSGTEGGPEDGTVSTAFSSSGANSMEILGTAAAGGAQDVLLLLGDKTSGHYVLSWDMYVPGGKTAYYNLQHFEAPGVEWAIEVNFDANGAGVLAAGAANAKTFSYVHDAWFQVIHYIDLDNDWASLYINNTHVYSWPFNWQGGSMSGTLQLGGVDFFPRNLNDNYYVDNVFYAAIPPAANSNSYCHTATEIDLGVHSVEPLDCWGGPDQLNAPSAAWFSWTAQEDGFIYVTSCGAGADTRVWIFDECGNRSTIGINDDECDLGTGDLYASYKEAAVTAGTTYYIAWDNRWEDTGFDFELGFFTDIYNGDFCSTALPADVGNTYTIDQFGWASVSGPQIGAFGDYTAYTNSEWYVFTPTEDMTVRAYSCGLATTDTRVWVYTGECGTYESLVLAGSSDDDCGLQSEFTWDAEAGTTYYIEWDDLGSANAPTHDWALEQVVQNVAVTFQVDLTPYLEAGNALETVKIAGNFADNGAIGVPNWDPPSAPAFTDLGNDVWSATIEFPASSAGQNLEFKFLNTADSWGDCGLQQECMGEEDADCKNPANDNRLLVIPAEDQTICFTWETCLGCNVVGTKELVEVPMTIAPNPFSNRTVVDFNTAILNGEVRLTTLTGQLVRTYQLDGADQLIIKKDGMTSGIYFLNVVTEAGTSVAQKLIVE